MATSLKLSELNALQRDSADLLTGEIASGDLLLISDVSANTSKKATLNEVSVCLKDTDFSRSLAVEAVGFASALGQDLFVQTLIVGD